MTEPATAGVAALWARCALVVPAGGTGSRMTSGRDGGCDKPGLALGPATLLGHLLAGVPGEVPVALVGPARDLAPRPGPVLVVREDPVGAGPAAAVGAGVRALHDAGHLADGHRDLVALCAGDAPWAPDALPALLLALDAAGPGARAAVAVDADGHRQPLLAVHRLAPLLARTAAAADLVGAAAGALLGPRDGGVVAVAVGGRAAFDVDTPADLARAHRLLGGPEASR